MIRKFTINPPFAHQPGDVYAREQNTIRQIRGGITIDTRSVGPPTQLTAQVHVGGSNVTEFFEEQRMPGQTVALTDVTRDNLTGHITASFSNGQSTEFNDFDSLVNAVKYLDSDGQVAQDALMLKTIRNSPDGTNLQNMVGGSVAINFEADVPFVLTPPV